MSKTGAESRAGVGVSSVLMVLVVLSMAALSMLAYSSARGTESITRRNAEVSAAYCEAAATVQRRLGQIDLAALEMPVPCENELEWLGSRGIENVEWYEENGSVAFTLTQSTGQGHAIVAEGRLLTGSARRYELWSHRLINEGAEGEETYLNLMGE